MFTGIIEEVGEIVAINHGKRSREFSIKGSTILENSHIGESIATNGVCLTIKEIKGEIFKADVMAETLRLSNLGSLNIGNKVNLERALTLDKRLGGHIVTGHIDGRGEVIKFEREDNATWLDIKCSKEILKYIVYKGSITIDGVSLTVAKVKENYFKVSIIPHTASETTLLKKAIGEMVNLECDIIGKYVEKLLNLGKEEKKKENNLSRDFLKEYGFLS